MSDFSVIYSDTAIDELREMRRYIARDLDNPEATRKWYENIISSAESLAKFPKRYGVRCQDSKGNEMREFPVKKYAILYSVNDSNNTVNISRVIYAGRDIETLI